MGCCKVSYTFLAPDRPGNSALHHLTPWHPCFVPQLVHHEDAPEFVVLVEGNTMFHMVSDLSSHNVVDLCHRITL